MPRLLNRQTQIPGGMTFYQPQTGWKPPRFASFDTIVGSLITHRMGNPRIGEQVGWATDRASVENEVDLFNALLCKQMGWADYYTEDAGADAFPKLQPSASLLGRAGKLAVGARTLIKWLSSGAEAVPQAQANARAAVCVACPAHVKGGLADFFTEKAQAAIQEALNQRREWKLSTDQDPQLQICDVCYCPMKLKVHMPLPTILSEIPAETLAELPDHCWMKTEQKPK